MNLKDVISALAYVRAKMEGTDGGYTQSVKDKAKEVITELEMSLLQHYSEARLSSASPVTQVEFKL